MRTLIVGDMHFRSELPYAHAFKDGRRGEWEHLKIVIHDEARKCDAVVLMGDNLNSRNNGSTVLREFIEFLKGFGDKPVHILIGNHERAGGFTALDFLDRVKHPNWHVYSEITYVDMGGQTAVMIPYVTPGSLGVADIAEANARVESLMRKADFAFAHHVIEGAAWGGGSWKDVEKFEVTLPLEMMQKYYRHAFAGHIHESQIIGDNYAYLVGSAFTSEVGEEGKYIWILNDFNNPEKSEVGTNVKRIPLPVRGIYKTFFNRLPSDSSILKIPDHSIVKCIVTDRLLNIDKVKENLKRFDAAIIVEQYPNEREKVHFEEGTLDLGVDNMLKVYADARSINYAELKEGFDIVRK